MPVPIGGQALVQAVPLHIQALGRTAYAETLALQRQLQRDVRSGTSPETLLLTEHDPVITLGRAHTAPDLRVSAEEVAVRGIQIVETERGGDITYHGPGQLVAYAIVDLRRRSLGAADFVTILEESAVATLATFGVEGCRDRSARGVWVAGRKIASVGVNVRAGVTMHGVAVNLTTESTDGFDLINPCGNPTTRMTSLESETGRAIDCGEVGRLFARALEERLTSAEGSLTD